MRQVILLLVMALSLTAYSQTASQATLLVEEAQQLESKQDYANAITKLKQAEELYAKAGNTQSAERATCLHILGRCYLNLERPEGLTYTQMAAEMRKSLLGENSIEYIASLNNTGLYYLTVSKEYDKATEIHGKAWELCSRIRPRPEQAFMFHLNLARCYIAVGDMDKASSIVEKEVAISKKENGEKSLVLARQFQQIGSLYYLTGHKEVGVTYYEQAFHIFPDDSKEYEQLLDCIATIYMDLNNQSKMLEYMQLVEAHNQKELEKPCNEPGCLAERAQYFAVIGDNDKARADFLEALKLCNADTSKETVFNVRNSYAQFLFMMRDYASAGEYYELAAEVLKDNSARQAVFAQASYLGGLSYNLAANYAASNQMFRQALSVYAQMLPEQLDQYVNVSIALCNNYSNTQEYETAIELLATAEKKLPAGDKSNKMGEIQCCRGNLLFQQERYAEAAANYQRAADIFKVLPECDVNYQDALSSLYRCHARMGNETVAQQAIQDAERQQMAVLDRLLKENLELLDAYRQQWGDDGLMYVSALGDIAGIYYTKGQTDTALGYMEPFLAGETTALRNLFRLSKADERMAIWQDIRSSIDSIPLRAVNITMSGTREQQQRFARLGYDALLFSKGIMLNSSIELESLIRASGDKSLLDNYNKAVQMAEQILTMQNELPHATNVDEARKKMLHQKEVYEQLQLDLMRKSADFGDYTRYLSVKWQDVQKHLLGNSVAIEFALIDDELLDDYKHLAAFVLRPGDAAPTAVRLMPQKQLEEEMQQARFWKMLDAYISQADTIYFSPDGILHQLPVEYLPYGSDNQPLAFQKAVYRLSSTKEIALNRRVPDYSSAVLFGGLDYEMASTKVRKIVATKRNSEKFRNGQNGYDELPYTLNEVNNVNALLKKKKIKTNIFVGKFGTEQQFRALDGRAVSLIHIATHGDYKELEQHEAHDAMEQCFLIMSGANATEEDNDGLLRADEISRLNLRGCRMAVLSACHTGQGTLGADGLFGLQRGFKNAGVQTILMTLSAVDDQASMLLMTQFYENLVSGLSERTALIRAQQYLRENGYAGREFWTPFILLDARN